MTSNSLIKYHLFSLFSGVSWLTRDITSLFTYTIILIIIISAFCLQLSFSLFQWIIKFLVSFFHRFPERIAISPFPHIALFFIFWLVRHFRLRLFLTRELSDKKHFCKMADKNSISISSFFSTVLSFLISAFCLIKIVAHAILTLLHQEVYANFEFMLIFFFAPTRMTAIFN